jgi:nucleoside-diphosphate-sugar epimerase
MPLEKKMEDVIWNRKKVLATDGTSFIGSHLVDALVERGAQVRVVDDLTSAGFRTSRDISKMSASRSSRRICANRA